MWCHHGTLHSPPRFLSSWAFCFKGSALRMFSFPCTCRCDSLPSDVPFFIWENPWCVLRDGHRRPRNYQHVQTPAISLQTKPAGRIFCHPLPERAEMSSRSGARVLIPAEARAGPGPEPAAGEGDVRGLLGCVCARHGSPGLTARLLCCRGSSVFISLLHDGGMNCADPSDGKAHTEVESPLLFRLLMQPCCPSQAPFLPSLFSDPVYQPLLPGIYH